MATLIRCFFVCALILAAGLGCAAGEKSVRNDSPSKRPSWIDNHPSSETHFIGVGSCRNTGDAVRTQECARLSALNDISQQIEITVASDISMNRNNVTVNDKVVLDHETFSKKIQTFTQSVLKDWEIAATWNGADGYGYCKVVLDKKKYYDRINRKVNDAVSLACEGLRSSYNGNFYQRVNALYKGLTALDDFPGTVLRASVSGKEVILNTELPRRMQEVLSGMEIHPNVSRIELSALTLIPDTLGASVTFDKKPDFSINIKWSASSQNIDVSDLPERNGLYPVSIKNIPASAGIVTITATADLGNLGYDILQRKFFIPSGSFIISRAKPRIYLSVDNEFCRKLADRLKTGSCAAIVSRKNEADVLLSAQCTSSGEPVLGMGIYKAKAALTLTLTNKNNERILDVAEDISSADAQSGSKAQQNAEKVAMETAVKRIEGAF
jgi:hypothetical protein